MKRISILLLAVFICFVLHAWPQTKSAMDPRLAEIAHKVVTISAAVKPGEVVVISGGIAKLPLLEIVAIEAAKAGGIVAPIFITTDRLERAYLADVPEEYLGQPSPVLDWLKNIDVWISTDDREDAKAVLEGIPDTKLSKAARSGESVRAAFAKSKLRHVHIGVPSKSAAEYARVDWATYQNMQLDAINSDYKEISRKGNQLAKLLESAKLVKITSPSGTDITMTTAARRAFITAGVAGEQATGSASNILDRQAALPGGSVSIAPIEGSPNGKIVAPKDTCRPYEYLTGATYVFKDGKMISFNAKDNAACFEQMYGAYSGDRDKIAFLQIGLNPALKVMEDGSEYRPQEAAGMVYIGMGDNQLLGGNNKTEFGWLTPVVKATVEVDGKTVVKDGQLAF
jgi:leucyl aminopeptidase (aminopeptidase T)